MNGRTVGAKVVVCQNLRHKEKRDQRQLVLRTLPDMYERQVVEGAFLLDEQLVIVVLPLLRVVQFVDASANVGITISAIAISAFIGLLLVSV